MTTGHPLRRWLDEATAGRFPPPDGLVDVLPPDGDDWLIVEFSGHALVCGDVSVADVVAQGGDGFGGAVAPGFVAWLAACAERVRPGEVGSHDVVLARSVGTGDPGAPASSASGAPASDGAAASNAFDAHPRVRRAQQHRVGVDVRSSDEGLVAVGRGVVGRYELSVELFEVSAPAAGAGRRLIELGLAMVPAGEWCFAQVAAGNTRSLRAFLASGFTPICAEILLSARCRWE